MVLLNGQLVPDDEAKVSIFDRSFLYGDGLFETFKVCGGRLFRCWAHFERLKRGAAFLGINLPFSSSELDAQCGELIRKTGLSEGLLRMTLSRGVGVRGYSPRGAQQPLLVATIQEAPRVQAPHPVRWRLVTSSYKVAANDPLTVLKTCNKLHQILARAEAEAQGADEALLLNTDGEVAETASANVFWIEQGKVYATPANVALPGITRAVVFELCEKEGIVVLEQRCPPVELNDADGVFLTLSSLGVVEVESLDNRALPQASLTGRLHRAYQKLVASECHPR